MDEEILKKAKCARKNDTRTAITISDRLDKLQVKVEEFYEFFGTYKTLCINRFRKSLKKYLKKLAFDVTFL